jgi:hypothetical protein
MKEQHLRVKLLTDLKSVPLSEDTSVTENGVECGQPTQLVNNHGRENEVRTRAGPDARVTRFVDIAEKHEGLTVEF